MKLIPSTQLVRYIKHVEGPTSIVLNGTVDISIELSRGDPNAVTECIDVLSNHYDFDAMSINGAKCFQMDNEMIIEFESLYTMDTNSNWGEDTWYLRGNTEKGIVLTYDCIGTYDVMAFERHDNGEDTFITLFSGPVNECLNYINGVTNE